MKNFFGILVFLLAAAGFCPAVAQEVSTQAETAPQAGSVQSKPIGLVLSQKLGFGTDNIPLVYSYYYNDSYISGLNALSIRYWLSEKTAVEFLGAYAGSTNLDRDNTGNVVQDPTQSWGLGLGLKYNVRQPLKDFFIQLVLKASYARNTQRQTSSEVVTTSNGETWGGFAGIGFEYFIPFFDSLSVESNIGFQGTINNVNSTSHYFPGYSYAPDSSYAQSYLSGDVVINGMTLSSLSIHFYF